MIILAGFIVILPGIGYWVWSVSSDKDPIEIMAIIFGMSISIHSIFSLFFFLLDIKLNLTAIIILDFILFVLISIGIIRKQNKRFSWLWLASIFAFSGLIFWRFWQARNLVLPAWVDSLHHTLIVRVITEQGGLPETLSPYLPGPFYYHYAFHIFTAHFTILSGLPAARAVLILGQVLNACIGLSIYTLAKSLLKDWRLAVLAGLLVSFVTMMPAYYLSWGRYTLLTGMFLLPQAMSEALRLVENQKNSLWEYLPFILFTAGTLLSHYFSAMLLASFLVILAIWQIVHARKDIPSIFPQLIKLTLAAIFALLITSPWLLRVNRYTGMTVTPNLSIPTNIQAYFAYPEKWDYVRQLLGPSIGLAIIPLALAGLLICFRAPEKRAFATWSLALFLLSLPWGLRFGSFRSDHFVIVLFLPISILSAYFLGYFARKIYRILKKKWLEQMVIATFCISLSVIGIWQTKDVINKSTVFVDTADYAALLWIDENLPANARFFINTTSWGFGLYRGVDGGAWIMPFTGRWSLVPTIFYPFGRDVTFANQIKDWNQRASHLSDCSQELFAIIQEAQLSHVYLHKGKGTLQAEALVSCPGFNLVYERDGVSIWKLSE